MSIGDNEWELKVRNQGVEGYSANVNINDTCYPNVTIDTACLTHSILLLLDAVKELAWQVNDVRRMMP
jgi:hypothetical protein